LTGAATAAVAGLPWVAADREHASTYTTSNLLVLLALLGALLAVASHPARTNAPAGRRPPVLAAGLAPPVAVVTADAVVRRLAAGSSAAWYEVDNRSLVAASSVLALCGLALGVIGVRGAGDRRRIGAEIGSAVPLGALSLWALAAAPDGSGELIGGIGQPSWLALLLLGVGATAAAIPADRRRVGWVGWALLSLSSAYRLARSDVGVVEAYTVPPALALIAVSALRLRRDRTERAWSTLLPGLSLLVVPSVLASAGGSALRPSLLIGLGALAVALTRWAGGRHEPVLLAAASVAAGGSGAVRALRGSALAEIPSWQEVELWSLPTALVLLAVGVRLLLTHPRMRSWISVTPGLVLLLIPTLMLALDGRPIWRVVLLTVLGGAVVAAGAVRRLQAPVVFGGVVLAVHAIAQLGPWVVRTLAGQPRWLTLAIVGALLLGLGATYERRLRELRSARMQLNSLR
ncbi:MAG: hypothetical protein WAL50_22710, partial [Kineosporiaceae bacterium]